MAESATDESLLARIQQLEQERDELRKDIEQLCMQQAGPGYLAVATRMHFQRTAGLEQEIESLKKKVAACTRDNLNLQEELSEAYRIKSQLADLHNAEVSKNMEAEKQVKFFQGCVAAAFAERDQAIIEAEKAKEKEEIMSQQINGIHQRIEELTSDCVKLKEFNDALQIDLSKQIELSVNFKMNSMDKVVDNGIADLKHHHSQYKEHIMNLLNDGESSIKSIINVIDERVRSFDQSTVPYLIPQRDGQLEDHECRDVHISPQTKPVSSSKSDPSLVELEAGGKGDRFDALAVALQEKVAALLLLSQQEERHLLERNMNAALQQKIEELQRNLVQVTNEKVKALVEFAQLKQEHQLLIEKLDQETKHGKAMVSIGESKLITHERDGSLKNLLKKTYLSRWIGPLDKSGNEVNSNPNNEGKFLNKRSTSMDFARMKIEIATFKESMESLECLTSSIHRLRLSLFKTKESVACEDVVSNISEVLNEIINEAKLVKTALGSSLPISWSGEGDAGYTGDNGGSGTPHQECSDEKIDTVSAAGLEMVELLIFAAQILRDRANQHNMAVDS
ncbi:putative ciliary rootlet coiled-coil protein 2 isoform X3 [Arachis ipaensis]|uniref:putative ciliary rootlet coiled-coil protein 2 isoform X3 n=1 Tax=Arachis ipaensis TaxID=130454 RepID=UPI000A2AF4A0|nr:putative ciliary rootlet coiled-coil protein 2 isoform X3 [Arachis ipaensis]